MSEILARQTKQCMNQWAGHLRQAAREIGTPAAALSELALGDTSRDVSAARLEYVAAGLDDPGRPGYSPPHP